MPKSILNIADVEFRKVGHGTNFPGAEFWRFAAREGMGVDYFDGE